MIANTIIRQGEVAQNNIVLYELPSFSLAYPSVIQNTNVVLFATQIESQSKSAEITVTRIVPGLAAPLPGVYPDASKVRVATFYGPTGIEYSGQDIIPIPADVKLNIGYGNNGTEFIGLLIPGGNNKVKRWNGSAWVDLDTVIVFQ